MLKTNIIVEDFKIENPLNWILGFDLSKKLLRLSNHGTKKNAHFWSMDFENYVNANLLILTCLTETTDHITKTHYKYLEFSTNSKYLGSDFIIAIVIS